MILITTKLRREVVLLLSKQRCFNDVNKGSSTKPCVCSIVSPRIFKLRSFFLRDRFTRCLLIRLMPLIGSNRRQNVSLRRSVVTMFLWRVLSMTLYNVVLKVLNLRKRKTKSVFCKFRRCATRICAYFLYNSDIKSSFDRYKVNTLWCEFTMHYVACKD